MSRACPSLAFDAWQAALPPLHRAHAAFLDWVGGSVRAILPPADLPRRGDGLPDLARWGRLPSPDPDATPLLAAHWRAMIAGGCLAPPFAGAGPAADPPPFRRGLSEVLRRMPEATPALPSPRNEGDNWCGALLQAQRGLRFTEIVGSWRVPYWARGHREVGHPAAPPPQGSAWIGLDGATRASRSLPQVGITFIPPGRGGEARAFAWFQWWVRDRWSPPLRLDGLGVRPGDTVLCRLVRVSATRLLAFVKNAADRHVVGIEADAPDLRLDRGAGGDDGVRVAGSTACWIVERPADPMAVDLDRQLHPLPDFCRLDFLGCVAGAARSPAGPGTEMAPTTARALRMTERLDSPRRTVVIARARISRAAPGRVRIERRMR